MKNYALLLFLLLSTSLAIAEDFDMHEKQQGSFEILNDSKAVETCRPALVLKCEIGIAIRCEDVDGNLTRAFCQIPSNTQTRLPCGKGYPRRCT